MDTINYKGDYLADNNNELQLEVYRPAVDLIEAVNLAILLKQPLLLMGEPGCGKTRLAEAVAAELHGPKYKEHYFRWDIKSTSKAKEGIYQYDALKRLYDANSKNAAVEKIESYISYGKFAEALLTPQNGSFPNVLLIDEIDKADIDFPNDLLLELEKGEFEIPELHQKITGISRPIVFITSNRERELPPAFLRRCLYYYIDFPTRDDLLKILYAKFGDDNNQWMSNAVNLFMDLRIKIEGQLSDSEKKPATSELMEWISVINHYVHQPANKHIEPVIAEKLVVIKNYQKGTLDAIKLPFPQILLKTLESTQLLGLK
jgi:MoxR-like ATPase